MRINKFIAGATGMSRRSVDTAIEDGRVLVNGQRPSAGYQVGPADKVSLDNNSLARKSSTTTIILNKPVGYVCSRNGQGSKTIYELLPAEYFHLKPVGRLDKDSSGLILLTDDGELAHQLTHPSFNKEKIYEVRLNKPLNERDLKRLNDGVELSDGISNLKVKKIASSNPKSYTLNSNSYQVRMSEGRNRQIRRTFITLGYEVLSLHRTQFGDYYLEVLQVGKIKLVQNDQF